MAALALMVAAALMVATALMAWQALPARVGPPARRVSAVPPGSRASAGRLGRPAIEALKASRA
jgi:hypothetical protein